MDKFSQLCKRVAFRKQTIDRILIKIWIWIQIQESIFHGRLSTTTLYRYSLAVLPICIIHKFIITETSTYQMPLIKFKFTCIIYSTRTHGDMCCN